MEFVTATQNMPFTVALTLMVFIGVVQVISLLTGGLDGFSSDSDLHHDVSAAGHSAPAEASMDVAHADAAHVDHGVDVDHDSWIDAHHSVSHSMLYSILGWLQIGRIPTMVVFILLLLTFGISGLIMQEFSNLLFGHLLNGGLASLGAVVVSVYSTGKIGRWIAPILPHDETEALSVDSFLGLPATIIRGTAARNRPAEAKFQDKLGHTHYVMVEPEKENETFTAGDEVQLILRKDARYFVIASPANMSEIKKLTSNS